MSVWKLLKHVLLPQPLRLSGLSDLEHRRYPLIPPKCLLSTIEIRRTRDQILQQFVATPETYRSVEDILQTIAAYFHLLPASQSNHHREAGGLLIHSLEVATAVLSNTKLCEAFSGACASPTHKADEGDIRLAILLLALTHDFGKIRRRLVIDIDGNPLSIDSGGSTYLDFLGTGVPPTVTEWGASQFGFFSRRCHYTVSFSPELELSSTTEAWAWGLSALLARHPGVATKVKRLPPWILDPASSHFRSRIKPIIGIADHYSSGRNVVKDPPTGSDCAVDAQELFAIAHIRGLLDGAPWVSDRLFISLSRLRLIINSLLRVESQHWLRFDPAKKGRPMNARYMWKILHGIGLAQVPADERWTHPSLTSYRGKSGFFLCPALSKSISVYQHYIDKERENAQT